MKPSSWASAALLGLTLTFAIPFLPQHDALAQVYDGPGLEAVTGNQVAGIRETNLRTVIASIVNRVLTYVALAAVVVIIIAGIYLILSLGNDSAKETAKKIVLYTAIGLLLILISKGLVMFFISLANPT